MPEVCANCGQPDVIGPECPRCGAVLAKAAAKRELAVLPLIAATPVDATPVLPEPSPARAPAELVEVLAVPAALAFGALVQLTALGQFLVGASAEMEMHELGHATALWLAGRLAIPLPMITITPDESRSRIAFVAVAAALGILGRAAWQEKLMRFVAACALLGVTLVLGTLFLDGDRLDAWVKFAGVGGELWLSALAMLAFHEKLPAMLRWARARWFFMVWGALAYAACARRWIAGDIPWGSFWGGDGDMDTLRDSYGWSAPGLVHAYRWIAAVCLVLVLARVLWTWRVRRSDPSPLAE